MYYIPFTCPSCGHRNYIEAHTDADAHFPSVACEECGNEVEDCPCDNLITETQRIARLLGSSGGKKGGEARAAKLTPEQRSTAARKAAQVRWEKATR